MYVCIFSIKVDFYKLAVLKLSTFIAQESNFNLENIIKVTYWELDKTVW